MSDIDSDLIPDSVIADLRERAAALPDDDNMATTSVPIPCMDCTEIGLSAIACDIRHRNERSDRATRRRIAARARRMS